MINTLLLYPSLSPHGQTDWLTDRETNTLASRGLEEPFFQLFDCVVLVFGSCGNKVFNLLSVCWVRGSGDYDRKKKIYSRLSGRLCCCISFWFWQEISIFFVVAGNFDYDQKYKRYSRLLAGNRQFFCCGGKFSLRLEKKRYITTGKKKDTVVSGGKLAFFL